MKYSIKRIALFLALTVAVGAGSSFASTVEKMNLAKLVDRSGRIIVGKCVNVETGMMQAGGGQLPFTVYTFAVSKSIKGGAGGAIEVRHFGATDIPGRWIGVPGMPTYEVGEEVVLLLTQESRIGLCVPVGLGQGCFRVRSDDGSGTQSVVNGFNNAGLFDGMRSPAHPKLGQLNQAEKILLSRKKGPIDMQSFVSLLEKLAN